jgi:DNA-binding transcriptional ArsR family regulator
MVQKSHTTLNTSFAALGDATRRGVLEHLGRSDASISDLADRFRMTLTGMKKHIGILEAAGFVISQKVGRVRTCRLGAHQMSQEAAWISRYAQAWEERFAALDTLVENINEKEKADEHRP